MVSAELKEFDFSAKPKVGSSLVGLTLYSTLGCRQNDVQGHFGEYCYLGHKLRHSRTSQNLGFTEFATLSKKDNMQLGYLNYCNGV